jgi:hypothetical protein
MTSVWFVRVAFATAALNGKSKSRSLLGAGGNPELDDFPEGGG